jgi:hypothetical protein
MDGERQWQQTADGFTFGSAQAGWFDDEDAFVILTFGAEATADTALECIVAAARAGHKIVIRADEANRAVAGLLHDDGRVRFGPFVGLPFTAFAVQAIKREALEGRDEGGEPGGAEAAQTREGRDATPTEADPRGMEPRAGPYGDRPSPREVGQALAVLQRHPFPGDLADMMAITHFGAGTETRTPKQGELLSWWAMFIAGLLRDPILRLAVRAQMETDRLVEEGVDVEEAVDRGWEHAASTEGEPMLPPEDDPE